VVTVQLALPDEQWEMLLANALDEQYIPADVSLDGELVNEVGLRFKGAYSSLYSCFDGNGELICDKLSMKIKFSEYVEDRRFLGLKRINLHSLEKDATKVLDCMNYDVFRAMGVLAPRCAFAFVYLNGDPLGLYGLVEQVDGRFTDSRFKQGNGNLYKEAWPASELGTYYQNHLKTNGDTAEHDLFVEFASEMSAAGDAALPETLGRWMDLDYLIRYMAVDFAIANWDGITTFFCGETGDCSNHNYYIYQEEDRARFWLVPWDLEASLSVDHWLGDIEPWDKLDATCEGIDFVDGQDYYIRPGSCDPTIRAIALADRDRYEDALREVLDAQLSEEVFSRRMGVLRDLIASSVEADPHLDVEIWHDELRWQVGELERVRERIIQALQ
jgi:spore coat protein CotH